ncbi:hypothetical protein HDU89_002991 [Geranomyces variabilis]|nr:hypothetical protein HDU89_002991 [Geranomyces variabilis]
MAYSVDGFSMPYPPPAAPYMYGVPFSQTGHGFPSAAANLSHAPQFYGHTFNHQTSSHNSFLDYAAGPTPPRTPSGRDHRTPAYKRHRNSRRNRTVAAGAAHQMEPSAASYAAAASASAPAQADAVNSDVSNPVPVPTWPVTVNPIIKERAERGHQTRQYKKDRAGVRARGDTLDVLRLSALVISENEGSSEEVPLVLSLLAQVVRKHRKHPLSKHLIQMGLLTLARLSEHCADPKITEL